MLHDIAYVYFTCLKFDEEEKNQYVYFIHWKSNISMSELAWRINDGEAVGKGPEVCVILLDHIRSWSLIIAT